MRVLMWLTVGFAAACAVGAYWGVYFWVAILALICAISFFLLKRKICRIASVVCLGLAVGVFWTWGFNALYLQNARQCDGKTLDTSVTVSDYSYTTDYGVAADAKVKLGANEYTVRLYLADAQELSPGDCITGKIRFRLTLNDSIQGQTYHQGDGIFLLGYVQEEAKIIPADQIPTRFFPAQLRRWIQNALATAFPADTIAFANALFLGDSSLLDYETDTDFKLSGIRHIIAVSGLHVSILMSVVFIFCGRNRYLSAIIGIPLLALFAAVVGFTPSVLRACIMQSLVLMGMFLNKEYDPPTSLAFAVLIMLCVNPITVVSVSFQLSTMCVVGIQMLSGRINDYLLRLLRAPKGKSVRAKLTRWFASSVSITLSTCVTTTPLSALYFGTISIVGVLTNLVTLWVVSSIFCGIAVVALSGLCWIPFARVVAWIVSYPMRFVILVARLLADLPYSAVYTKSVYIVIWIVFSYCLFLAFFIFKKKYPKTLVSCIMVGLIIAIAASWLEPKLDHYRITVFDVGQGQSILVQYEGKSYLVDCGGDSNNVAADTVSQHLASVGISHLDGIIVTHYDKDHAGGVPNLLTSVSAQTLYLPDIEDETGLKDIIASNHDSVEWISEIERSAFAGLQITMIPGEHISRDNERSMCVLFQIDNCDILITGDRSAVGEKALLKEIKLPEIDILVAGHHGSETATSLELLEAVNPDVVVISVGRGNYYGHPAEETLYRLRLFGCSIWRTDRDGTIVFRG